MTAASYRQLLPAPLIFPRSGSAKEGPALISVMVRGPRRCVALVAGWTVWRLRPALRCYVIAVIAAAVIAASLAAALTSWRVHDALVFGMLVGFGAAAIEFTRRTTEPAGLIKDVHAAWQLPIAFLLPPVYCLIAPTITIALLQIRTRRTIAHRRVFTAGANGLALGAASLVFHVLPVVTNHAVLWLLAIAGCALLQSAANKALVMTAVRGSDRTVSIHDQLFSRGPLFNDACEIAAAVVICGVVSGAGLVLLIPVLPLVVVLQRSFRHSQLLSEARIDPKTGLLNGSAWRAEAEVQLARVQNTGAPVAVAIIDLDQLKVINDAHGWPAGDTVIAGAADVLKGSLRSADLLGRFGGEEFVLLLPATMSSEAIQIGARLRSALAAQPLVSGAGNEPLRVTVSIGIAATDDPASRDLADLLAAAYAALDQAKQSGRNAVHLAVGDVTGSTGEPEPAGQRTAEDSDGDRERIAAARQDLGRGLAAWRKRAGLSQAELARRAGYSRSAIADAETGGSRSADFWAAVDREVGAEGRLIARHAQMGAAVTAVRRRAARQAWKERRQLAHPGLADAVPQDGTVAVTDSACPHCGEPLALATHVTTTLVGKLTSE